MFGIFKKKLKEVVKKISEKFEGKREEIVEKEEQIKKELEVGEIEKPEEKVEESKPTKEEVKKAESEVKEEAESLKPEEKQEGQEVKEEKVEVESERIKKESEEVREGEEKIEEVEEVEEHIKEKPEEETEVVSEEKIEEKKTEKQPKEVSKSEKVEVVSEEAKGEEELEKLREEVEKELPEVEEKIKEIEQPSEKEFKEVEEEIEQVETSEEKPKKEGFFRRFVKKITERKITEDDFNSIVDELKITLLQNDVAFEVVEKIVDDMKKELVGKSVKRGKVQDVIIKSLKNALLDVLKQEWIDVEKVIEKCKNEGRPALILFVGFNGVGKTTTLAKLGFMLKNKGHKVVFAAGDTFRAASIEQLEFHGKLLDIPVIKHKYGADSAAVIFDAVKHAKAKGYDVVLADTAGRSHSNVNLMDELKKVVRVNNPDFKILVIDSLTGNDAVEQARRFDDAVGIDGIILTKFDVNDRGGAALSVGYITKKPILYVGVGQDYPELMKFEPEFIVNELLAV